ncbi:NlpC/P60 family protein [Roseateles sp. DC23W]|uniref:NlpC/P60 family protein n=1 Tax=Pelomonas dachongensis TaxID=3299029 RepID=A0ABW7EK16_9BURK
MTPSDLRALLQEEARRWIGTPYHHQGCVRGAGVDCLMLLVAVFKAPGVLPAEFDPRPYAPQWHLHRSEETYLAGLDAWLHPLPEGAPLQPGDVVVWRFGRTFSHAGLVVQQGDQLEVLHALAQAGEVTQDRFDAAVFAGREMRAFTLFREVA